jgi:hypothetical protein
LHLKENELDVFNNTLYKFISLNIVVKDGEMEQYKRAAENVQVELGVKRGLGIKT